MKRSIFILTCFLLLFSSVSLAEKNYESLKTINSFSWAKWFDQTLGFIYDSHGCLHFSPSDVFLLYKTIPAGIPLKIKKYQLKKNEPPFPIEKVPYLIDKT
ncbi:hypothetical protein AMJ44_07745, partial [candidate division WOR-1 bacterium DG_54_3]